MPIQKQTVAFPLVKGIDKSRPNLLLEADQLEDGVNTEILESGEITKRPGFATNVTLPARTPLALIEGNGAEGVAYSNNYLAMPYVSSGGAVTLQDTSNTGIIKPTLGDLSAKVSDLIGINIRNIFSFDSYTNPTTGEVLVAVVVADTTARVYKFDKNFNIIPFLSSPYAEFSGFNFGVSGLTGIKCLEDRVFYIGGTSGIKMVTFNSSGIASNTTIQTGPLGLWDVCDSETNEFILTYPSGGNIVVSRRNRSDGSLIAGVNATPSSGVESTCVFTRIQSTAGRDVCLAVARQSGNKISLIRYNSSLVLQQTSDQTGGSPSYYCVTGVATSNPAREYVAAELSTSTASTYANKRNETWFRHVDFYYANGTTLSNYGKRHLRSGIVSKGTQLGSGKNPFVMLYTMSEDTYRLQNAYILVQFGNPSDLVNNAGFTTIVAQGLAYSEQYAFYASVSSQGDQPRQNLSLLSSTKALMPLHCRQDSSPINGIPNLVLRNCIIELDTNYRGSRPIKISGQTYTASGRIYNVSGSGLKEAAFNLYPDPPGTTDNAGVTIAAFTPSGSATIAAGVYQYCLVYEFIDDSGNLIESAPSQVESYTVAAGGAASISINYRLPGWISYPQFKVVAYRTDAGGIIFYRTAEASYDTTSGSPSAIVSLVDTTSNTVLKTNKILYTTGGVVENIAPPNAQWLSFVKNRLWTYEYGSYDTVWFSKEIREGFVPQFSDLLTITVPRNYGEIVGVAGLDDKIVVFKQFGIYVIVGDGPTETLTGAFSQPASIASGIGCINSRSILETPQGIFFQSQEGIYIIDRSMAVQFIGQPLYKSEGTILSAAYDPVNNRVFYLSTTDLWVYYATTGTWHRWTVTNPVDIDYLDNELYLLTTTRVLKLTAGTWQDAGANYEQRIKLGQMQFSDLQGYQRVYRVLAQGRLSDAPSGNVTVSTFFDGSSSATDTQTIAQSAIVSGSKVQLEVRPSRQKCESMQLQLSHTANNSGLTISGLTAEVGTLGGAGRRAATGRAV